MVGQAQQGLLEQGRGRGDDDIGLAGAEELLQGEVGAAAELAVPLAGDDEAGLAVGPGHVREVAHLRALAEVEAGLVPAVQAHERHLVAAAGHRGGLVGEGLLRPGAAVPGGEDIDELHAAFPSDVGCTCTSTARYWSVVQ